MGIDWSPDYKSSTRQGLVNMTVVEERNKLKAMFLMQEAFMKRLANADESFPKWPLDITKKKSQQECRDLAFNSMGELFEAVQELKNSKKHRQTEIPEFDRQKFVEELVDAFKYFLEILIFVGVSPQEFFDAYCEKDAIINKRIDDSY